MANETHITSVLAQQTTFWTPAQFFNPALELWQPLWVSAAPQVRQNLANAWLWSYVNHDALLAANVTDDYWSENVFTSEVGWLRAIEPYLDRAFITRQHSGNHYEVLEYVFDLKTVDTTLQSKKNEDPCWPLLRTMWFGPLPERRAALAQAAQTLRKTWDYIVSGNLLSTVAWDIANESRLAQDIGYASAISYYNGVAGLMPPKSASDAHRAWQNLGLWDAQQNKKERPGRWTLTRIQEEFRRMPDAALATALSEVLDNCGKTIPPYGHLIYTYTGIGQLLAMNDPCAYDVLRLLVPEKTPFWNTAQSLETDFKDACAAIAAESNMPLPVAPTDFDCTL